MENLFPVLLVLLFVLSTLNQARKKVASRRPPPPKRPAARPAAPARASLLDRLRRDLERAMEEANAETAGPLGRRPDRGLPEAEEVEERDTAEGRWADRPPRPWMDRPAPEVADLDDQAEAVALRRIREAEARDQALSTADHREFDRRIRPEPAAVAPVARPAGDRHRLRQAIVWREILGPPVSLR